MLLLMVVKRHEKGDAKGGKKVGGQFAPTAAADSPAGAGNGLTLSGDPEAVKNARLKTWQSVSIAAVNASESAIDRMEQQADRYTIDHEDGGRAWRLENWVRHSHSDFRDLVMRIGTRTDDLLEEDDLADMDTTRVKVAAVCENAYRGALRRMLSGHDTMDDVVNAAKGEWNGLSDKYRDTCEADDARKALYLIDISSFNDTDTTELEKAIHAHWVNTVGEPPGGVAPRRISNEVSGFKSIAKASAEAVAEDAPAESLRKRGGRYVRWPFSPHGDPVRNER